MPPPPTRSQPAAHGALSSRPPHPTASCGGSRGQGEDGGAEGGSLGPSTSLVPRPRVEGRVHSTSMLPWSASPLTPPSPLPLEGGEPGDVSDLLAACNAYVDNIVSENQRMRSKLLSCRTKLGSTSAEPTSGRK